MGKIKIFTDGGSRGNPGPAAIGFVIFDDKDTEVFSDCECIGNATNNVAEYQAVICALEKAKKSFYPADVELNLDSELVCRQLNGVYKVKDQNLKELYLKARERVISLGGNVTFKHVRREQNKEADKLVNEALDKGE